MHHLRVESLSKLFALQMLDGRQLHALEDVSFAVDHGEFLGVVGRSGSGKSSLLRCLYRRYLPTSGRILYDSEAGVTDLAAASDREVLRLRKEELGYVSQFLRAIPRTPALDVVAGTLVERGVGPEESRERAASVMDALGMPPALRDAFPATMSGGEQQRVNLARALVARPRFLLLDEPTSALDPETRALAVEAILQLKGEGTTMIGIFHEAESLTALADRVLALEGGRVRWCGPAHEAAEILEAVYSVLRGITNARVVTPEEVLEGATVTIEEGRIAGVSRRGAPAASGMLDAGGRYLLPGLVDLHSDAIEKQLAPRSGVELSPEGAFLDMDGYFAASGITTGFHALSFMDGAERSLARSRTLCEAVLRSRAEGLVRHEMHLRCELPDEAAVAAVEELLRSHHVRIASMMDHTPGQGQFRDLEWFRRYWVEDAGADESRVAAALEAARHNDHSFAIERVERLGRAAGVTGAVLASHDDDSPQRVESLAEKGVKVSEFPIDAGSARKARDLGMSVCMGAPNAVRGVSSGGNLCATRAVELGLVDALCSDYHPPSMLRAAFKLAKSSVLSLPAAVGLVSRGPAIAADMPERGGIREGHMADLIVVGERLGMPSVRHALVGGTVAYATEGTPPS